ncbi:hypothetical protein [Burkholderia pseudomultivorans]|uniref:hypothetical protein n=1 Tax=Burkholderia pseudomultivorans TaxID=1207504 RepID=UPI000B1D7A30|nr:hypothetical protein [Burkholderia pseudomultivorans]
MDDTAMRGARQARSRGRHIASSFISCPDCRFPLKFGRRRPLTTSGLSRSKNLFRILSKLSINYPVNMKRIITLASFALAVLGSFLSPATAMADMAQNADDGWMLIALSKSGDKWYAKRNSGQLGTLDGKYKDVVITYKRTSPSTDHIELGELFAKVSDCERGEGLIYYANMDGKATAHDDFVVYGGTIASALAESVCATLDQIAGTTTVRQVAPESMWINVVETNNSTFYIKKGSAKIYRENGVRYMGATLKSVNTNENRTTFGKASISERSCKNEQGEVFYFNINYADKESSNFVKDGGNGTSGIGEALCALFGKKS